MFKSLQDKENTVMVKSPKSPNILKPKPISFKRKQKQLFSSQPLTPLDPNVTATTISQPCYLTKSPVKRVNPFRCLVKRKRNSEEVFNEDSFLQRRTRNEFNSLSNHASNSSYSFSPVVPSTVNEDAHSGFDTTHFLSATKDKQAEEQSKDKTIPVDWSLKTKIRLTSAKPFPWRTSFKTSEEASGTTGYVRCLHPDGSKQCTLDSSHGAKFYQQCLVWVHPTIPWLNLFPRLNSNTVMPSSSIPALDMKQRDVLHSSWCDSFRSLYQLVRMCQCPFFYLCAPSFTVLFRAGGVDSILDIHAAITPTTRGFRNALKEEGIEFTMPLYRGAEKDASILGLDERSHSFEDDVSIEENCEPEGDKPEAELADADQMLAEDEEPGIWLESLGLSQEDFPLLKPNRTALAQQSERNVDNRPESLVFVEGSETQALVNFLLNYPSCTCRIGPMAGVPPTLLSPVAFLGASLQSHKVRHGKVRVGDSEHYAVELSGPLLPNTIHSLCSLFNSTQDGNFSAVLATHQQTTPFARLSPENSTVPSAFATENLKDCGVPRSFIHQMCSRNPSVGTLGINTIKAESHFFTWS